MHEPTITLIGNYKGDFLDMESLRCDCSNWASVKRVNQSEVNKQHILTKSKTHKCARCYGTQETQPFVIDWLILIFAFEGFSKASI